VDRLPRVLVLAISAALTVVVSAADIATSADLTLAIFYAVPVALTTWSAGRLAGLVFALAEALTWTFAGTVGLASHSTDAVFLGNVLLRLAFFAVEVAILAALRESLARERELARVDALTGLDNLRQFRERLHAELVRAARLNGPLSLAVFDVDGLKRVNDEHGHAVGDQLLVEVARSWRSNLRSSDLLARTGGDEFAVILPDTGVEATVAVENCRRACRAALAARGWTASVSVGVVTWLGGETGGEGLVRRADELMYEAKASGKDAVRDAVAGAAQENAAGVAQHAIRRTESHA